MVLRAVLFLIAVLTALFCQHVSKHKTTPQLGGVMQRMRLADHQGRYLDNTWKVIMKVPLLRARDRKGSSQVIQRKYTAVLCVAPLHSNMGEEGPDPASKYAQTQEKCTDITGVSLLSSSQRRVSSQVSVGPGWRITWVTCGLTSLRTSP